MKEICNINKGNRYGKGKYLDVWNEGQYDIQKEAIWSYRHYFSQLFCSVQFFFDGKHFLAEVM